MGLLEEAHMSTCLMSIVVINADKEDPDLPPGFCNPVLFRVVR